MQIVVYYIMNKISKNIETAICVDYLTGKYLQLELAQKYDIHRRTVQKILERNTIPKREHGDYESKKYVNDAFFEPLSAISSYWLGFIYGDGNIDKNNLRIMLSIKDLNHLEHFKEDIESEHLIRVGTKPSIYSTTGEVEFCKLAISRKSLVDTLKIYRLHENKTNRIRLPNLNNKLLPHFVRGYFDADGCISITNTNRCMVTFTGNYEFIDSLQNLLIDTISINTTKIIKGKGDCYSLFKSSKKDLLSLYNYMYKDNIRCLQRKFDKFTKTVALISNGKVKSGWIQGTPKS